MRKATDFEIRQAQENMDAYGYAANPFCDKCGGYGRLHPADFNGYPDYSRIVLCKEPGCLAESFAKYKSGTKSLMTHGLTSFAHTLQTFKKVPGSEAFYKAFYDLAEGNHDKPLLLGYGGTGNGKTHLAEAVVIRLMQRGIDTWYYSMAGFMNLLKRQMETHELDTTVKTFCEVAGLVLDDWGAEYGSDWERSQLDHIIDERYRWHRITVLTSNKDIEQLKQQNERVISRFTDKETSVIVLNKAADYRPHNVSVKVAVPAR